MPPTHTSTRSAAAVRAELAWQAGRKLMRKERYAEAVQQFQNAARWRPLDVLFGLNLADALLKSGEDQRALQVAEDAVKLEPHNSIAIALRVNALMRLKRYEELVVVLGNTSAAQMSADLYCILGSAQVRSARPKEAIEAFLKSLALKPDEAETHYRLGLAFNELNLKEEAAECFRTALLLGLGPSEAGVRDLLAFFERDVCDWSRGHEHLAELREAIVRLPADAALQTNPFVHVTLLDDPVQQLSAARSCARFYAQTVTRLPAVAAGPRQRLRLGYVTADVRQHATAYLMAELLERHDRSRFEVTLYSHGREDTSPVRERMVRGADHYVAAQDMSSPQLAQRIRDDGIDILVDLKGYTHDGRPAVFACRPAPVQVAYLGFPGTTGADYMDYVIGDPYVTPMQSAGFYSEKIAQLPGCYQCNDGARPLPVVPSRASQGLPDDALVLCGFNQAYKISPEVFDVWCRLLHRLPSAVLWLHSWNLQSQQALKREATARGIAADRLVFASTMEQTAHLNRIGCADLFIDTWPCNAHTTASDALWAGLPLVTLSGQSFASRVAGSLLHAIGMPETVCDTVQAYEDKIMQLATDKPLLTSLRARVQAARQTTALFSSACIAPQIEELYERMWERALTGLPPEHLEARC